MSSTAPERPATSSTGSKPASAPGSLRSLQPSKVVETIGHLFDRIRHRFPGSGLANIALELHAISKDAVVRADRIRRPNWWLRVAIGLLIAGILAVLVDVGISLRITNDVLQVVHFVQLVDSSLASLVLIGAAIAFLIGLEVRLKRQRALNAVRELRSLAHIVDMHQLTKDPEHALGLGNATLSSPKKVYTQDELVR